MRIEVQTLPPRVSKECMIRLGLSGTDVDLKPTAPKARALLVTIYYTKLHSFKLKSAQGIKKMKDNLRKP